MKIVDSLGLVIVFVIVFIEGFLILLMKSETIQALLLGRELFYREENSIFFIMGALMASGIYLLNTMIQQTNEKIKMIEKELEVLNRATDAIENCRGILAHIFNLDCRLAGGLGKRLQENARLAAIIFNTSPEIFKLNNREAFEILLQHEEFFDVSLKETPEPPEYSDKRIYKEQKGLAESCDNNIYKQISDYVLDKK
jgi:hypothetical protein